MFKFFYCKNCSKEFKDISSFNRHGKRPCVSKRKKLSGLNENDDETNFNPQNKIEGKGIEENKNNEQVQSSRLTEDHNDHNFENIEQDVKGILNEEQIECHDDVDSAIFYDQYENNLIGHGNDQKQCDNTNTNEEYVSSEISDEEEFINFVCDHAASNANDIAVNNLDQQIDVPDEYVYASDNELKSEYFPFKRLS